MISLEENLADLHLSLESDDSAIKSASTSPERNDSTNQITKYAASDTLFLSRRRLGEIPQSILKLTQIKNLYLEGNKISTIPDNLFRSLSNLVWLDLRNNQISSLPAGIGQHRYLKTLLLEGNPITELPLQLGHVVTLKALNLRNCPISFPPQDVVEQGLPHILRFLRCSTAQPPLSIRSPPPVSEVPPVERLQLSELAASSLDLCEEQVEASELRHFEELKQRMIQMERAELWCNNLALAPPTPTQRHPGPAEGGRFNKTHPLSIIRRKKELGGRTFSELHPSDVRYRKRSEERRGAAMMELKEKQAILEQRRKDQEQLKEWRSQARIMREKKFREYEPKRRDRLQEGPKNTTFGTDMTSDLNDSDAVSCKSPEWGHSQWCTRPHQVTAEARAAQYSELGGRIQARLHMMRQRHRQPRGTPQEETQAARQEMEEVKKLQNELANLRRERDLGYRFTACTGENWPSCEDK